MLLSLLLSCAPDPVPYTDCDPLVPQVCALPWPSAQFLEQSGETWSLNLGPGTLPPHVEGPAIDPWAWNEKDGFSIHAPLLAWFPDLSPEGLPVDGGASLREDSTVVLVDLDTGERVPVRAELSADDNPTLVIHPTSGLAYDHWYAVGLLGLVDNSGQAVVASQGFAQLRDGTRAESWDIEGRRELYESAVFPTLASAGAPREQLQLAWHFKTATQSGTLGRSEQVRELAKAQRSQQWQWTEIREYDCEQAGTTIAKSLEGELSVPLFTDSTEAPTLLNRDGDGQPYSDGQTTVPFIVRVPCSLMQDPSDALLVQYGHGLFQDRYETKKRYLGELQDTHGWVLIAADWHGLSRADALPVVQVLSQDIGGFGAIPERTLQGWTQLDAVLQLARETLVDDPELQVQGQPLIHPEQLGFLGISQGGVLGGGYVGWSTQIERAVLNVPGTPFAMLLPRSTHFGAFESVLNAELGDPRAVQLILSALQTLWDPAETAGWTPVLAEQDRLLIQHNLGDSQVPSIAGQRLARSVGAELLAPATRPVWGMDEVSSPTGSVYVEWDYSDISQEPAEPVPADPDTDTHFCSRQEPAAWEQMDAFLRDGAVVKSCDGACRGQRTGFCEDSPG